MRSLEFFSSSLTVVYEIITIYFRY